MRGVYKNLFYNSKGVDRQERGGTNQSINHFHKNYANIKSGRGKGEGGQCLLIM